MNLLAAPSQPDLEYFVDGFESACQRLGSADLEQFLPPADHPLYRRVLRELICIDLDYGWSRGEPTPLDEYRTRFPELFDDPECKHAVVWEEFRQRQQLGQAPDIEEYQRRYGVDFADYKLNGHDPKSESAPSKPIVRVPGDWAERLDALGARLSALPGLADKYQEARQSNPAAADKFARTIASLPQVGETFAGFRLEAILGTGAFGRVYLARQIGLSNRLVALKISTELFGEAQTLARLQHTNIVPIYSPHQVGSMQALCMPYFGGTTLADVLRALSGHAMPASGKQLVSTLHDRKQQTALPEAANGSPAVVDSARVVKPNPEALAALERLAYPEAILWLCAKLADGLAHAHSQGIIHRDLKPANILLTDDGQPMLLDFNLADNTTLRGSAAGARIGGTLPYMSPEQLRAYTEPKPRQLDGRSDIYSLGLILFELITGRPAFPELSDRGSDPVSKQLIARLEPLQSLRPINPAVTPAVEAIVRKCLEPAVEKRYQSARDLQEDIERHLNDLPLKHVPEPSLRERFGKWTRRHPKLLSGSTIGLVSAAVIIAIGLAAMGFHREVQRREAADSLRELFVASDKLIPRLMKSPTAEQRGAALAAARDVVNHYQVLDREDWQTGPLVSYLPDNEQSRLRNRVGELLFLMANAETSADSALRYNDLSAASLPGDGRSQAWWEQRAELLKKLGQTAEGEQAASEAQKLKPSTVQDHYLRAVRLYESNQPAKAIPHLLRATADDPRHYWAWFLLGNCYYGIGQPNEAIPCYSLCIGLDSTQARAYFNRARSLSKARQYRDAIADYELAWRNEPSWMDARIEAAMERYRAGLALSRRARLDTVQREILAQAGRGLPEEQKRLFQDAESRLTDILAQPNAPTRCWFFRSFVRRALGDKAGADADSAQGLARVPAADDDQSWLARGFALQNAKQPEKALADFQRAEQINPKSDTAMQHQAHILTEPLNRLPQALDALDRLIAVAPLSAEGHAGRAVVLARMGRIDEAIAEAEWVKSHSADPLMTYQIAGVYARSADRPGHAREALRLLADALVKGEGYQYLDTDPELESIRGSLEFRNLLSSVRTIQGFLKADSPPKQTP